MKKQKIFFLSYFLILILASTFLMITFIKKYNFTCSISFNGDDIEATVTGKVSRYKGEYEINLKALNYSLSEKPEEKKFLSWKDIDFSFNKDFDSIIYTIKVENKSEINNLYIFVDGLNAEDEEANIKADILVDGKEYLNKQVVEILPIADENQNYATFSIRLDVLNKNQSIQNDLELEYSFSLYDNYTEVGSLGFILDNQNLTASVKAVDANISGDIVIPDEVTQNGKTFKVTSVADNGFADCVNLTNITLPKDIDFLGKKAFSGCTNLNYTIYQNGKYLAKGSNQYYFLMGTTDVALTEFNVHADCKYINYRCFHSHKSLEKVVLPQGLEKIGFQAFVYTNIKTISIPSTVTTVYEGAFGYTPLESIVLPNSVTTMERMVFYACEKLKSASLPNTLKAVPISTFYNCTALESVVVTENTTEVQDYAFFGCTKLSSCELPDKVTKIGRCAFYNCSALDMEKLPSQLEIIDEFGFSGCRALDVKIPNSVKQLGRVCFQYAGLTDLTLPENLEFIGDFAINHCNKATNTRIVIPSTIKQLGGQTYDPENPNPDIMGTHVIYDSATTYVEEFVMAGENPDYMTVDGVLYGKKNGVPTVLIAYPSGNKASVYNMPDTVVDAFELSMSRPFYLKEIVLSDSFIIKQEEGGGFNNNHWANNLSGALYLYTGVNKITIKASNPRYISYNGQVYSKDGKTLYFSPVLTDTHYQDETQRVLTFKNTLTTIFYGAIGTDADIKNNAIAGQNTLKENQVKRYDKIIIPASVTFIDDSTFSNINYQSWIIEVEEGNAVYEVVEGKLAKKQ